MPTTPSAKDGSRFLKRENSNRNNQQQTKTLPPMNNEWTKRPFARVLLVWCMGIIGAVYLPPKAIQLTTLTLFLLLAIGLCWGKRSRAAWPSFEQRWCWGGLFLLLFMALALEYTTLRLRLPPLEMLPSAQAFCQKVQFRLLESFDDLPINDAEKSLLGTICLGYRQELSWTLRRQFSLAGAAHILAVSGFHVGVVYSFCRLLLFGTATRTRFYIPKQLVLLGVVWFFAALTGLAASAVRAALMLSFYIVAHLIRRRTDSFNITLASAFCMLVYNPFYLFDLGFELSYAAVLSILFFYRRIQAWITLVNPIVRTIWQWFAIALAAQFGSLPLCLYYFGEVSSVVLLTALPVSFFSCLLIPAALLWAILHLFGWTPEIFSHLIAFLVEGFVEFIERMGQIPPFRSGVSYTATLLFLSYLLLFIGCWLIKRYEQKRNQFHWSNPNAAKFRDLHYISIEKGEEGKRV